MAGDWRVKMISDCKIFGCCFGSDLPDECSTEVLVVSAHAQNFAMSPSSFGDKEVVNED